MAAANGKGEDSAPKRANGEGSIYQLADGTWMVVVTGTDGGRVRRKPTVQTRRGAERLLRELIQKRDEGALTRGRMTVAQFKPIWLAAARARNVRPRTLQAYEEKLDQHVIPRLGKVQLSSLTGSHIEALYAELLERGKKPKKSGQKPGPLSPQSVAMVHQVLHSLLKLAKRKRLVGRIVTEDVDPPKTARYQARSLTLKEARAFLVAVADHHHGALWTYLLGTGCRFGEAAGLTWAAVDFEEAIATIRQAVTRIPTPEGVKLEIREVKTDAGHREAPLAPWVIDALKGQRVRVAEMRLVAGRRWQDLDLVFPNTEGGPLRENHVNTTWHRALRRADLPPIRMHDLRHTKGTLMIDEGEELVVVQRTLGHASPTITANIYVGKVPKALRRAADRFGELLDPRNAATG